MRVIKALAAVIAAENKRQPPPRQLDVHRVDDQLAAVRRHGVQRTRQHNPPVDRTGIGRLDVIRREGLTDRFHAGMKHPVVSRDDTGKRTQHRVTSHHRVKAGPQERAAPKNVAVQFSLQRRQVVLGHLFINQREWPREIEVVKEAGPIGREPPGGAGAHGRFFVCGRLPDLGQRIRVQRMHGRKQEPFPGERMTFPVQAFESQFYGWACPARRLYQHVIMILRLRRFQR